VKGSLSWHETGEEEDGRRRGGAAAEAGGAAAAAGEGPAAQRVLLHHQPTTLAYVPLITHLPGLLSSILETSHVCSVLCTLAFMYLLWIFPFDGDVFPTVRFVTWCWSWALGLVLISATHFDLGVPAT
jgi:hypothetical protein